MSSLAALAPTVQAIHAVWARLTPVAAHVLHFGILAACNRVTSLFRLVLAQRAVWPVVVIDAPAGADQIHLLVPATRLGADQAVQLVQLLDLGVTGNRVDRPP